MLPIILLVGAVVLIVWYQNSKKGAVAPAPAQPVLPGAQPAAPATPSDGGIQATFPITTIPGSTTSPPAATATGPTWRRVGRHGHEQVTVQPGARFRLVMTAPVAASAVVQTRTASVNKNTVASLVQNFLPMKGSQVVVWAPGDPLPPDWPPSTAIGSGLGNGDPFGPSAWRVEGMAMAPATWGDLLTPLGTSGWQAWVLST